jgi:hypothetical protein
MSISCLPRALADSERRTMRRSTMTSEKRLFLRSPSLGINSKLYERISTSMSQVLKMFLLFIKRKAELRRKSTESREGGLATMQILLMTGAAAFQPRLIRMQLV